MEREVANPIVDASGLSSFDMADARTGGVLAGLDVLYQSGTTLTRSSAGAGVVICIEWPCRVTGYNKRLS
jgi:hypothetical protein